MVRKKLNTVRPGPLSMNNFSWNRVSKPHTANAAKCVVNAGIPVHGVNPRADKT